MLTVAFRRAATDAKRRGLDVTGVNPDCWLLPPAKWLREARATFRFGRIMASTEAR